MTGLLTTKEAAAWLKVTDDTLRHWRSDGIGPAYVALGDGPRARIRYNVADLEEFVQVNTKQPSVRAEAEEAYRVRV